MTGILMRPEFAVFTFLTLVSIVPVCCHYWFKLRRYEMEIQLKHELVARGMTVDEIVRVVQATAVSDGERPSESDDLQPASI